MYKIQQKQFLCKYYLPASYTFCLYHTWPFASIYLPRNSNKSLALSARYTYRNKKRATAQVTPLSPFVDQHSIWKYGAATGRRGYLLIFWFTMRSSRILSNAVFVMLTHCLQVSLSVWPLGCQPLKLTRKYMPRWFIGLRKCNTNNASVLVQV